MRNEVLPRVDELNDSNGARDEDSGPRVVVAAGSLLQEGQAMGAAYCWVNAIAKMGSLGSGVFFWNVGAKV